MIITDKHTLLQIMPTDMFKMEVPTEYRVSFDFFIYVRVKFFEKSYATGT